MRIMSRIAAWIAVLGLPAVAWALARTAWALWEGRGTAAAVDNLVAMGAAGIGAVAAGYLAITGWAMLLGAVLHGGRAVPRFVAALAPPSWQRVTATALGISMTAGVAGPALASSSTTPHVGWGEPVPPSAAAPAPAHSPTVATSVGWTPPSTTPPSAGGGALAVGFVAAPPEPAPLPSARHQPPAHAAPEGTSAAGADDGPAHPCTYTVEHGDSLWRITAALLGPGASDASINRAWPQLYAANADAVGADPALIHPGLVLTVPTGFQP